MGHDFFPTVSMCQQEGDGAIEATLSSAPASIRDLLGLMGDNGRSGRSELWLIRRA